MWKKWSSEDLVSKFEEVGKINDNLSGRPALVIYNPEVSSFKGFDHFAYFSDEILATGRKRIVFPSLSGPSLRASGLSKRLPPSKALETLTRTLSLRIYYRQTKQG